MTPDAGQDPQAALRAATDTAAEESRARLAEIEADRSTPEEDLLGDAAANPKTQTEIAAERRAAEMRAAEAAASQRTPAQALAAHTPEEAAKVAPASAVAEPEKPTRGTLYRVLRQVNLIDPGGDSGQDGIVSAWLEVGDVAAPNRDAAIKSIAMAMIENAMRDGATLTDAFAAVQGTLFAAPPASSFVATPANPTINLRVG